MLFFGQHIAVKINKYYNIKIFCQETTHLPNKLPVKHFSLQAAIIQYIAPRVKYKFFIIRGSFAQADV